MLSVNQLWGTESKIRCQMTLKLQKLQTLKVNQGFEVLQEVHCTFIQSFFFFKVFLNVSAE